VIVVTAISKESIEVGVLGPSSSNAVLQLEHELDLDNWLSEGMTISRFGFLKTLFTLRPMDKMLDFFCSNCENDNFFGLVCVERPFG
jgi:hypothetical protein